MKKQIIVLLITLLFSAPVLAAEAKFPDISENHWAAKAVNNLVKMGVTQGYPDGTYQGSKNVTRYEVAVLLSKLIDSLGGAGLKDVQADLEKLRADVIKIKKESELPISGSLETQGRMGKILFTDLKSHGPMATYRLKTSLSKKLNDNASVKINLDTMDAGFNGGDRDLAAEMLDFKGIFTAQPGKLGLADLEQIGFSAPIEVVLTVGPGALQHVDATKVYPSDDGIVYTRPDTGVSLKSQFLGAHFKTGYYAINRDANGRISSHRFTGTAAYTIPRLILIENLEVAATSDYYLKFDNTESKDLRAKVNIAAPLFNKVKVETMVGLGTTHRTGMMVSGKVHLNDILNTGTKVTLTGSKIGSKYITFQDDQFDYAGLDNFNRPLENATVNFGGEVVQSISSDWRLKGKGDVRMSSDFGYGKDKNKSRATAQIGLTYDIAPQTEFDAFYRVEQDPTLDQTSDLTGVGLLYHF